MSMPSCGRCPFYIWEQVLADPFNDPKGQVSGWKAVQMCTAGPDDFCQIDAEMNLGLKEIVKPCPTCGRDIDGYDDCPDCLAIELMEIVNG